jgi:hypothetical protein
MLKRRRRREYPVFVSLVEDVIGGIQKCCIVEERFRCCRFGFGVQAFFALKNMPKS